MPAEVRPVTHQGELLGGLSIEKRPGDALTPTEDKLIDDLASQAGLVLRNASLIQDLRASRQRLVAAQDDERRKIERNLHDGAQQQLVALSVKAGLAQRFARSEPERAEAILGEIQSGHERRPGEPARSGPRDLPPAARRQGAHCSHRCPSAQGCASRDGPGRRDRSVPAGDRRDRLLLHARSAEQHREVRGGVAARRSGWRTAPMCCRSRSRTTAAGSIRTRPATAPGCRVSRTGSRRSGVRWSFARPPGAARRSPGRSRSRRQPHDPADRLDPRLGLLCGVGRAGGLVDRRHGP